MLRIVYRCVHQNARRGSNAQLLADQRVDGEQFEDLFVGVCVKVEEKGFDITYEHVSVFSDELLVVDVRRLVFEDEESIVREL